MSSISPLVSAVSCSWPLTPAFAVDCEAPAMTDPIIGLIVALGLAAYLIYALVKPEKF
jgi:K+-transporting ATPase KdpF subunit